MGLRDGFESEAAKLRANALAEEEKFRSIKADAEARTAKKQEMLSALMSALKADFSMLAEADFTLAVELQSFTLIAPAGTIKVSVKELSREGLKYSIEPKKSGHISLRQERAASIDDALTCIGKAAAHIVA